MIKILFIRSEKAFLPEIDAYIKFFNKTNEFNAYDSSKIDNKYDINNYDVIWEFKGTGGVRVKDKILVHEYASLSTGPFPKLKNTIKSTTNPRPNLRIFLNENVKKEFNFKDDIDYCYRDMGIDESFMNISNKNKEYDFLYVGSICKGRGMDLFLNEFIQSSPGKICLVGNVDNDIYNTYKKNKNIIFTGKVSYLEVPQIASKAIYGINYIPNKYPFNIQTSTKLLEYLALGLKVITTDYKWVRQFEEKHGCSFYKLKNNIKINMDEVYKYNFISNFNSEDFLWENIIKKSRVNEILLENIIRTQNPQV